MHGFLAPKRQLWVASGCFGYSLVSTDLEVGKISRYKNQQ